jgi:predicted short-subunit dehydrogenase-like oxidoreductase (DUF2520 family)
MKQISSISVAGAGNVAHLLASALHDNGIQVNCVWNRTPEKAVVLADKIASKATDDMQEMQGSDVIICAVSDDALGDLIPRLSRFAPVVSTSGTANVLDLDHAFPVGVFYPLQSFSRSRSIDLSEVPFFVESSDAELTERLIQLAGLLSPTVAELHWEKRVHLHLAAVFVNNFTNHLFDLVQQQLARENLSFEWLKPLIRETIEKLDFQTAHEAQTGPARRNDVKTIEQHIRMLPEKEAAIYKLLTDSIRQRFE